MPLGCGSFGIMAVDPEDREVADCGDAGAVVVAEVKRNLVGGGGILEPIQKEGVLLVAVVRLKLAG